MIAAGTWSISPGEGWIMHVVMAIVHAQDNPEELYLTTFTDNEAARAMSNKLKGSSLAMRTIALAMANAKGKARMPMRAFRVTTHENKTADDGSREGGEAAADDLAIRLGVPHVVHAIEADDPSWQLIVPNPSRS